MDPCPLSWEVRIAGATHIDGAFVGSGEDHLDLLRVNGRAAGELKAVQRAQNVGNVVCVIAARAAEYVMQRIIFGGPVMKHARGGGSKWLATTGSTGFPKSARGQSLAGSVVLISRNEGITNLDNTFNGLGAAGGVGGAGRISDEPLRGQRRRLRIGRGAGIQRLDEHVCIEGWHSCVAIPRVRVSQLDHLLDHGDIGQEGVPHT